ncbi:MAG: cation:proton antiporter [Paludibacteraceae bacterium]|nr:cation:proton antiporter [Paludibacteraceae bacterium]MBQ2189952.1 cation:proton antiporter [Paludibacteraceae bacterium]MBQ4018720.1 cation:proton antiporter [Paludibacteraceae bacterium]
MITNPFAIFALVLATILLVPMICRKIRIPSIVGFIVVGMIVGTHGFGLLAGGTVIQTLGKIGMLYIMLQAGIEVDVNDFRQQRSRAIIYGIYSFILPFSLGLLTSRLLGYGWDTCALLGAMYGSHTLMTYPIVSRYGVQKNAAVNIAIGGTMLTITLALLVLAYLKSDHVNTWHTIGRIALTLGVITLVFPWLAQRFFKRWSDATSGFLIVMTMMVVSAWMADWSGLEGILGAFICGVVLNRLVPNLSPVMQRINFVGNNIFVPLFLIGVGMMIDISVLWEGWTTIIVAVVMIATKLLSKWLAAWLAQISFGLQSTERQLIFGLTHATAAGTLAIVTIGYETGIFEPEILNATVLMILVLCTSASFITEYAAKRLALQEEARLEADKADNSWLMLTVAENRHYELQELSELGELHEPDFASESDWTEAKKLINSQRKAAIVYHPSQPINTINRLLVAVPRYAEKEHDFITCFGLVRRLSSQLGAKVVFYTNEDTQHALHAFCRRKGKYLRASYREMEDWEDVLMIAKQMMPDDMVVLINARPSTPSYNPLFEQVPKMLDRFFSGHSYMLVYPEQETGAAVPDIMTGDQTQASKTWSIVSAIKGAIVRMLVKIQTR